MKPSRPQQTPFPKEINQFEVRLYTLVMVLEPSSSSVFQVPWITGSSMDPILYRYCIDLVKVSALTRRPQQNILWL